MTILPKLKKDVLDAASAHMPRSHPEQETGSSALRTRGRPRRWGTILTAGAAVAAAVAAALVLLVGAATTPLTAYALTRHPDGTVTVTVRALASAIPELNARFARLGIDETVVPIMRSCKMRGGTLLDLTGHVHQTLTLTPGRRYLLPGWHGVLAAEVSDGKVGLIFGAAQGRLPSCLSTLIISMEERSRGHRDGGFPTGLAAPTLTEGQRRRNRPTLLLEHQTRLLALQEASFNTHK